MTRQLFCSTIVPTVGRPTLSRAVTSALEQSLEEADFEVIVVNDSGRSLPAAAWQQSPQVRVLNTQKRERCVARNTGAAVAWGRYLHFLDDDDWLLPDAYAAFWHLAQETQAVWLYGGYNFVDATGRVLQETQPDEAGNLLIRLVAGEWLPIQASMIKSEAFFAAGGFEPGLIPFEDSDLVRQVALENEFVVMSHFVANIVRSDADTTTDYSKLRQNARRSREKTLSTAGAFGRMWQSASQRPAARPYWLGRVTSAYLGSAIWNLQHWRAFRAVSRGTHGLAALILAGPSLLNAQYWRGALRPHRARTFLRRDCLL